MEAAPRFSTPPRNVGPPGSGEVACVYVTERDWAHWQSRGVQAVAARIFLTIVLPPGVLNEDWRKMPKQPTQQSVTESRPRPAHNLTENLPDLGELVPGEQKSSTPPETTPARSAV